MAEAKPMDRKATFGIKITGITGQTPALCDLGLCLSRHVAPPLFVDVQRQVIQGWPVETLGRIGSSLHQGLHQRIAAGGQRRWAEVVTGVLQPLQHCGTTGGRVKADTISDTTVSDRIVG